MNLLGAQLKIIDFGFPTKLNNSKNLAFSTLGRPIKYGPRNIKKILL